MRALRLVPPALLILFLLGFVISPLLTMLIRSLESGGTVTMHRYVSIIDPSNAANTEAVLNSVIISLLSVVTSAIVGTFLAIVLTQVPFAGKSVLARLAVVPIGLPPLVGSIAILLAFGESGVVPRLLNSIGHGWPHASGLSGMGGILAVHTYSFFVYFYLMVSAAIRALDGSQFEAAATLGAGPWRTLWSVLLPALRPSFLGASVLTFMASMASFTAPLLFAGDKRFLTLQIYFTKLNGDLDTAAAQSVLLAGVSIAFFVIARAWSGERTSRPTSKGVSNPARLVLSPPLRYAVITLTYSVIALALFPFVVIIVLSFAKEGSWTWQIVPDAYTLDNYLIFVRDVRLLQPVGNSILMACSAMAVAGIVGVGIGWLTYRIHRRRLARTMEIALASPYALPGTVVAIALIQTFGTPSLFAGGAVLVGTFWILPIAYVFRTYPLVLQPTTAALESLDPALPEAAASLGASGWLTFRKVVLPAIRPAVVSGILLVGIMAAGEFVASVMLYAYPTRPISVEIFSQLRVFSIGSAAAYSVVLLGLVLGMIALSPDGKSARR
jgi:iron(III) transport system permease protein